MNVQADDISNHKQLDEIDAPLSAFDVRDERLMSTERLGNVSLREASGSPLVSQRFRDQLLTL